MLITLLAWIYISFLSWMWGILFLQFIKKILKSKLQFPHFSIICIIGLSAITVIAGTLSLFIPLGKWWVQFLFIIPSLFLFFKKDSPAFFTVLKKELQDLQKDIASLKKHLETLEERELEAMVIAETAEKELQAAKSELDRTQANLNEQNRDLRSTPPADGGAGLHLPCQRPCHGLGLPPGTESQREHRRSVRFDR